MKDRIILHCDINNFFASVECASRSDLKDKPVAVTGATEKRNGIILAKNYIAKKFGVKTGEAIWEAKQKCPSLVYLPPHYAKYEQISKKLQLLYLDYTDFVEPLGLDECWLDLTNSQKLFPDPIAVANEIRNRIKDQFQITASVGVSFSKLFAKLGSDLKKPDATTVITRENYKEIVYKLPVSAIIGIGHKNEKKLAKINVYTLGDYVLIPTDTIKAIFHKPGVELKEKLLGNDYSLVANYYNQEPVKSVGNGTTMLKDIIKREDISKVVSFLSERISGRLIRQKLMGSTISVSLRTNKLEKFRHSRKIFTTNSDIDIAKDAMRLIDSFWSYDIPLRTIRIKISSLISVARSEQISFFSQNNLSKTITKLKDKFGEDSIIKASDTADFINRDRRE